VRVPPSLMLVPLLAAGVFLPPLGDAPLTPAAGVLGMKHDRFTTEKITLKCGQTLTMENSSRYVHIIGPGDDGNFDVNGDPGVPIASRKLMETNNIYTTGAWTKPGTYHVTCSVHPTMNLEVVVTDCCC
jgi:plastocyanin